MVGAMILAQRAPEARVLELHVLLLDDAPASLTVRVSTWLSGSMRCRTVTASGRSQARLSRVASMATGSAPVTRMRGVLMQLQSE